MFDNLGERMKKYENHYRFHVMQRSPVIIRIDGKAFHSFTKGMDKPFDEELSENMDYTTIALLNGIQNARFAYVQSDEISLLLIDYNKFESQQWFLGNIQKMVSVSASIASSHMSRYYQQEVLFDSRVFVLPESEVINYFIWRQQDATRNSISMVAQSLYSPKELHEKNSNEQKDMIFSKGINWNTFEPYYKRGRIIYGTEVLRNIPIFSEHRDYLEHWMKVEEK